MKHCSSVVHLAASTNVTLSNKRPEKCIEDNVLGTFNLLKAASENHIEHFISASTGGALMGDVDGGVNESMAPNPQSIYGASKLAAEGLCSAFAGSFNLPTLSLRFSNIYGEYSFHKTSAIAMLCKSIFEKKEFELYGDGKQVRDYLYVKDLAKIIVSCLEQRLTGTIQLGSGKPTQLSEVISLIDEINSYTPLRIQKHPKRLGEVERTWCDIGLAKQNIKYYKLTDLKLGLQQTFNWFSAQYNPRTFD